LKLHGYKPGNSSPCLKKTQLKAHLKKQWVIPEKQNGEFVARMEDILEVYALPRDENIPLVCMDEQPVQLLGNRCRTVPMKPGNPEKEDYQYTRNGTCAIFMFTAPLEGWRHVDAQEHRTKVDWAKQIEYLVNVVFPDKQKIRLVQDNLNTHTLGSLYEAFEPEKARAIAKRLDIHYTPKHGSWLNIAEFGLSALTKQCLCRRISESDVLRKEISAWELSRNEVSKSVNCHFTTSDATG
jgi:hypothetical protein